MRMQRGRMAAAARREKTDTILRSTDRNTQHHGSSLQAILMTYDDVYDDVATCRLVCRKLAR